MNAACRYLLFNTMKVQLFVLGRVRSDAILLTADVTLEGSFGFKGLIMVVSLQQAVFLFDHILSNNNYV